LVQACFHERTQGAGQRVRYFPQSLREGTRHVKPGILGVTLPSPHRRELLKLPANRTQVTDQQVQILPRGGRQPVARSPICLPPTFMPTLTAWSDLHI
jgi:hypothetical protein